MSEEDKKAVNSKPATSSDEISDEKFFENATKDLKKGDKLSPDLSRGRKVILAKKQKPLTEISDECINVQSPNIYEAICSLKIPNIPNDKTVLVKMKTGGQYSYSYTTYKEIRDKINPLLKEAGLFIFHIPKKESVITKIFDKFGNFLQVEVEMKGKMYSMQDYGGQLSYAKRYGIVLLLGLSTESDSDGQDGEGNSHEIQDKEAGKDKPWFNHFYKSKMTFMNWLEEGMTGEEMRDKILTKYQASNQIKDAIASLTLENIEQVFEAEQEETATGFAPKKPTI